MTSAKGRERYKKNSGEEKEQRETSEASLKSEGPSGNVSGAKTSSLWK